MSHWKLGNDPFSNRSGGGILKMPEDKSIQQQLVNDTAAFVETEVAAVLVNNSIKITEFKLRQVIDNLIVLEYEVNPSMTNLITNIKMLKQDDSILSESNVYVPVTQTVLSKHSIRVKEG